MFKGRLGGGGGRGGSSAEGGVDKRWVEPGANEARQSFAGRRKERRDQRDDGVYVPPTEDEALEWRDDNHPRVEVDGEMQPFPLTAGNADIGLEFGPGICMYFIFIKWLAVMFFFMFVLSLPTILINNFGKYVGEYTETLNHTAIDLSENWSVLSTTLGNIPAESATTSYIYVDGIPGYKFYVKREDMLYAAMAMDFLGVVLLLLMTVLLARRQKQIVRMIDLDTLEVSDYTVMVKGLPPDVDDVEEVRCFFELKYGKVYEVHLARNDGELLQLFFKRGERAIKLDRAKAIQVKSGKGMTKVDKLQAQVDQMDEKIQKLQRRKYYRTVAAFVTFSDESSRNHCLEDCPQGWMAKLLQKKEKKFRGTHSYTVEEARPPTNILFENMEYSLYNRWARRFVVNFLVFVLLLVSFFTISLLKDAERNLERATNVNTDLASAVEFVRTSETYQEVRANLNSTFDPTQAVCSEVLTECELSVSDPQTVVGLEWGRLARVGSTDPVLASVGISSGEVITDIRRCSNEPVSDTCPEFMVSCYPCYCQGLFEAIDTTTRFQTIKIIHDQCGLWIASDLMGEAYKYGSVVSIVLVNMLIKMVIRVLVDFEKHQTISKQHASITLKIFVAQLLNTAVLSLAANADLDEVGRHLQGTALEGKLFEGSYRDFAGEWYRDLGTSLCWTVAINVFVPRVRAVFLTFAGWIKRLVRRGSAITQRELNALYTGHEFDLSGLYGEVLMNVVVVLIYSSGMPILYLILSAGLLLAAIGDKQQLLKVCKRPPRYSENVSNVALAIMPWACALHLCIGIWMHSHFPTDRIDSKVGELASVAAQQGLLGSSNATSEQFSLFNDALSTATDALDEATAEQQSLDIENRVLQTNAFPLLVLLVLIVQVTVGVRWVLMGGIWPVLKKACCGACGLCKDEIEVEGLPNIEDAIMTDQLKGVQTYALKDHPKYMDAFYREGSSTKKSLGSAARNQDEDDATVEDIERLLGMSGGGGGFR